MGFGHFLASLEWWFYGILMLNGFFFAEINWNFHL